MAKQRKGRKPVNPLIPVRTLLNGEKRRILVFGDGGNCSTGFATVVHSIFTRLSDAWEIHLCGVNHDGDPHNLPFAVYPAMNGGDLMGYKRVDELIKKIKPHIIFAINDPWVVGNYWRKGVPSVCYVAIDAPNLKDAWTDELNKFDTTVFYTEYGKAAAEAATFAGISAVIPHGIDGTVFERRNQEEARNRLRAKGVEIPDNAYIVGNVNRNSERKRLDLSIMVFAQWIQQHKIDNAYLYLHCAERDQGIDPKGLAADFGIADRLILPNPPIHLIQDAWPVTDLVDVYNSFDVQMTTSAQEGWGLTTMEGMACGVPQVVPHWSALSEWPNGNVYSLPVRDLRATTNGVNTLGATPAPRAYVEALQNLYSNPEKRAELSELGYNHVRHEGFSWDTIAARFHAVFEAVYDIYELRAIAAQQLAART